MPTKKPRLTWRKQPNAKGLAKVAQAPRGAILRVDGEDVVHVAAASAGWIQWSGWYWYTYSDKFPFRNTSKTPVATLEDAKREAEAHIRENLKST
jgi:hypothetical protein